MKSSKKAISALLGSIAMVILIIDAKTAASGAAEAVELCIKTLIPSLFPFFLVTTYLNASIFGLHIPGIDMIGKTLRIPDKSESLLLLGLIGGYPAGAQLINEAYQHGQIDKRTGHILLGYCNNAGPAFIFGITQYLFSSFWTPFIVWGIHLFSAIITGILLPRPISKSISCKSNRQITIVQALQKSLSISTSICGWVILFKTLMAYIQKWLAGSSDKLGLVILTGMLELSNGCFRLTEIPSEQTRFILCVVFLAFGGVCVMQQTLSVTETLGFGLYVHGKIMQTCISLSLTLFIADFLYNDSFVNIYTSVFITLICGFTVYIIRNQAKKSVENLK